MPDQSADNSTDTDISPRDPNQCSDCGSTNVTEAKAITEIVEGPHRGGSATVNMTVCDECGALVNVQKPISGVDVDAE